jgi:glycosyltransferase involved in cell wall biosynthesis
MKLIIQIPCYNEANTLEDTIRDLPSDIPHIDTIEFMVIDDGSTDDTVKIARQAGVHHVIRQEQNKGLASTFYNGITHALALGADIVVNTDGDNQYNGKDIPKLVQPILEKKADIVVGCRPIVDHPEFSFIKKILQRTGSWVMRGISKTDIRDASSGFRAYSREACIRMFLHTNFSHCMETLIQAGNNGLQVLSVDIRVNPRTRKSRLYKSIFQYLYRSILTILSMFILYRPGFFFFLGSIVSFFISILLGLRFVYLVYMTTTPDPTRTYLASVILLSIFATFGMILLVLALYGELAKAQRKLLEEILINQRKHLLRYSKEAHNGDIPP